MHPERISSLDQLEETLSTPCPELTEFFANLEGDVMILGAGGKMGPSLALLAKRAADAAGRERRIIAVSTFSSDYVARLLETNGIAIIRCDLLDRRSLALLPDASNIIYMAGRKFGTSDNMPLTWALNSWLPGTVMERFPESRIIALSTGNVYPLTPIEYGGSKESDSPAPVGEYAQSCLGRERIVEYWSNRNDTPSAIIRLNYAIDLRYGVLLDIGTNVYTGRPVDLRMGHVNVIWQGDANTGILMALKECASPACVLNVTGPETISVRSIAEEFGMEFAKKPLYMHEEETTALLSDASAFHRLMAFAKVPLRQMIAWTAYWIAVNGHTYNKPTHFEQREGVF